GSWRRCTANNRAGAGRDGSAERQHRLDSEGDCSCKIEGDGSACPQETRLPAGQAGESYPDGTRTGGSDREGLGRVAAGRLERLVAWLQGPDSLNCSTDAAPKRANPTPSRLFELWTLAAR